MPMKAENNLNGLPRYLPASELCKLIGVKDPRVIQRMPIRRVKVSGKCTRYLLSDFLEHLEARTIDNRGAAQ